MSTSIQLGNLTFPTRFTLSRANTICLGIGDNEITYPFEVCSAFNRHFTDIGPSLASKVDTPRVSLQILLNLATAAALIWD